MWNIFWIIVFCIGVPPAAFTFAWAIDAINYYYYKKRVSGEHVSFLWRKWLIIPGFVIIFGWCVLGLAYTIVNIRKDQEKNNKYEQVQEPLYRKL